MKYLLSILLMLFFTTAQARQDIADRVEHHYADNDGVKIHYVTLGEGPLVVMLHGFPDYWYTWRHQMEALAGQFKVAAMDLRGYNQSDQPDGVQAYAMRELLGDVAAVIQDAGAEQAVVVGHDWGAAIAWQFAMYYPQMTERLIVLSVPHPQGLFRELTTNPEQQNNSSYAYRFQEEDAHKSLTAEGLAGWVQDAQAKPRYIEAFERSDFEAMLNYYKANYPQKGASSSSSSAPANVIRITCPVLALHGLEDSALLPEGFNSNWQWVDADLTVVSIPDAAHFIQHEAEDLVTRSILMWLNR